MRPALDRSGKLLPPPSRQEAQERVKQLRHECQKIVEQLASTDQNSRADYASWVGKATEKMRVFHEEENQILSWLEGYKLAQTKMSKEVTKLLDLVDLKIDLTEEEMRLLENIEKVMTQ